MIVAGVGFRGAVTAASLQDALRRATGDLYADVIAVPDDKALTPAFVEFAADTGVKVVPVTAEHQRAMQTLTQAPKVLEIRGTGSVAEACALAVAGPQATLITTRHVSSDRMATCALAKGESS